MGNGGAVSYMGFKFKWKAANPSDQQKIEAFIDAYGLDKCQEIPAQHPALKAALDSAGGLPDDPADLPEWFDNMSPDQGAAIAAAFPQ